MLNSGALSLTPSAAAGGVWYGGRGMAMGAYASNVIDYITIATTSNATDFGNLLGTGGRNSAMSNGSRAVAAYNGSLDYVTIASTGNAVSFGTYSVSATAAHDSGHSSSVRGLWARPNNNSDNTIDYITISTTSNSTDFGDLTVGRSATAATGSNERCLFAGGNSPSGMSNVIDYVTIATTGNATDFGNMTISQMHRGGCSNNTRAIIAGGDNGGPSSNVIEYVTISTTGNGTDFGDLSPSVQTSAASNGTSDRGVFLGGYEYPGAGNVNNIQYITISTTSNSTDFGDLTTARYGTGGCSGD